MLYKEYLDGLSVYVKVFGIPLFKIKRNANKAKIYLFNFIPILKN